MTNPNDPVGTPPPTPTPPPAVPPAAPAPAATPGVTSEQDARTLSMVAHILNFTLLGPLIIYLIKKGQNAYLDTEAKEALNFSLTCLIAHVALAVLESVHLMMCLFALAGVALTIGQIVLGVMGGLQARDGKPYRYPLNIRFIK